MVFFNFNSVRKIKGIKIIINYQDIFSELLNYIVSCFNGLLTNYLKNFNIFFHIEYEFAEAFI